MGGERRRVAGAQPRPRQHARDGAHADQRAHGREAEGQVALRAGRHELVRGLRLRADRPREHRLPAGPELERLRTRPRERPAALEARVQPAERRPERHLLRLGPSLRRDDDERVRARSQDREARVVPPHRPQRARGHRDRAAVVRPHRPVQHGAEQRDRLVPPGGARRRVGTRRGHGRAAGGSSTRSRAAPRSGASPRSTAAAACGIRRRSTTRAACSSPSATRRPSRARRSTRTARAGPGRTSTRTRSSHSTGGPEGSSGTGRRCRTTCATTTSPSRPSSRASPWAAPRRAS